MALIAHFKFDGDTDNVLSGYSNTSTEISYNTSGKIGSSAVFNGTTSFVNFDTQFRLLSSTDWAVSLWVKTSGSGTMSILSHNDGGPVGNDIRIQDGKLTYFHYNGAWHTKQGTKIVNDGKWHNLTIVNFSNNTMNTYVDGYLDLYRVESTQSGFIKTIGRNWSNNYFLGEIDDFRIYTGTPITENEILNLSFNKK